MSEKIFNTRIQHKHDIEANWLKATNFVPKAGELIVYDPDENFSYARTKMGDGVTNINDLSFMGDIFWAIADVTSPYAIYEAYKLGKQCYAIRENTLASGDPLYEIYKLEQIAIQQELPVAYFSHRSGLILYWAISSPSGNPEKGIWSFYHDFILDKEDISDTIDETGTDLTIPSTKATYNFVTENLTWDNISNKPFSESQQILYEGDGLVVGDVLTKYNEITKTREPYLPKNETLRFTFEDGYYCDILGEGYNNFLQRHRFINDDLHVVFYPDGEVYSLTLNYGKNIIKIEAIDQPLTDLVRNYDDLKNKPFGVEIIENVIGKYRFNDDFPNYNSDLEYRYLTVNHNLESVPKEGDIFKILTGTYIYYGPLKQYTYVNENGEEVTTLGLGRVGVLAGDTTTEIHEFTLQTFMAIDDNTLTIYGHSAAYDHNITISNYIEIEKQLDSKYIKDDIARVSQIQPIPISKIDEICNATIYAASEDF